MEVVLRLPQTVAVLPMPLRLFHASSTKKKKRIRIFSAKLHNEEDDDEEEEDPYFRAAMKRASLRFQETTLRRPDPLFADPYVGCLLPPNIQMEVNEVLHKHCLATKFIDDKLLGTIKKIDGLRQVVLLTDGMDTRPFRLNWPASTLIFDVSPERIFRRSIQKLEDAGAKIPRSCLFLHVPSETSDIQQVLRSKGFNGARPSLWVFQGLPVTNLAKFKEILGVVSNLAMKGCFFFGELPSCLVESDVNAKSATLKWMDKLFMSNGLRVEMIEYDEVVTDIGKESSTDEQTNILFAAEQLHYSDAQMEIWRTELQRIEDEGDEEGFEEL